MLNFLEKFNQKFVGLLFPFLVKIYVVMSLAMLLAVWSVPPTYWRPKVIFFWLWLIIYEINWQGTMNRNYLPIQPASSLFYHIYRFLNRISFLFLLVLLVVSLIPAPRWLINVFFGVFLLFVILRLIGDREYRPKKPEE